MKKCFQSLACLMVFLLLLPVAGFTRTDSPSDSPAPLEKTQNGNFTIYVQNEGVWEKIGTLLYDKHLTEKTLSFSEHIRVSGKVNVKIEQHGGGAAHIDSVLLNGTPPAEVRSIENSLKKLSKKDLDVIDAFGKTIEIAFDAKTGNNTLALTARIESTVIGKIPFQFPTENTYKDMSSRSSFYTYRLNSEQGSMHLDGSIVEVADRQPFLKEFSKTGSGHPSGYTYGWVWNDEKNLYVALDFTPDNTMDGDKDYAKVYTNVGGKIKEFKVSVPEQIWGMPGFTYTGSVGYQHKTYEFRLPLSEIFSGGITQSKDIQLAFAAYGTATAACPEQTEITYTCPFTPTAPTINGAASSTEWPSSAQQFNISFPINTFFYCMVDGANLYILVDAVGDTTQSTNPSACDECFLQFNDGTTTYWAEIHSENGTSNTSFIPTGGVGIVGFGSSMNSGTAHRIYEWKFPLSSINLSPGGQIYFAAPAMGKAACGAGASMPYDGAPPERDNVWPPLGCFNQGNLGTWGKLQFPADDDGDGVPDEVEDAAPNGGDGNGDGTADKYQSSVTSLPSATGQGYITLEHVLPPDIRAQGGRSSLGVPACLNTNVQALTESSQGSDPLGLAYPYGLLAFNIADCDRAIEGIRTQANGVNNFSVQVTVYYHGTSSLAGSTYRKFGPTPPDFSTPSWYTLPNVTFGTANVGGQTVATATFVLSNGQLGDDTDGYDWEIVDQGGPGQPDVNVPTMNEWGMIIFMLIAGLGSVVYLKRMKKADR